MNHVPEGRGAIKQFMLQQGYVYFRLLGLDDIFYHPDFNDELLLKLHK